MKKIVVSKAQSCWLTETVKALVDAGMITDAKDLVSLSFPHERKNTSIKEAIAIINQNERNK
jgi:hypothetical protein